MSFSRVIVRSVMLKVDDFYVVFGVVKGVVVDEIKKVFCVCVCVFYFDMSDGIMMEEEFYVFKVVYEVFLKCCGVEVDF